MACKHGVALLLIASSAVLPADCLSRLSISSDNFSSYSELASDIDPIYYLHLPDSGSGLASMIAHQACSDSIPKDATVLEPSKFVKDWAQECNSSKFMKFTSWFDPLTDVDEFDLHHVVAMFREPYQRTLSGYYNNLNQCWDVQQKYNCIVSSEDGKMKCDGDVETTVGAYNMRNHDVIRPIEYARCVENCTTNMLTGRACAESGVAKTDHAVDIVSKLGFVGLENEWALSVCLWHRKFGGWMVLPELSNAHRGIITTVTGGATRYDEGALLGDWVPKADKRVFEAASIRFWKEIDENKINRAECEQRAMMLSQPHV